MARTLRRGFIDPEETAEYPHRFPEGTSKAKIIRDLRRAGYTVGKELDFREVGKAGEKEIIVTDIKRTGNIASGFDSRDGYDLSDIDNWTSKQKQKLSRVFGEVKGLSERPFQIYRPRKRENLEVVQKAAQHQKKIPELNVAFVPVGFPGEKAEIKIGKRRQVVIKRGKETIEEKPMVTIQDGDVKKMPTLFSDLGLSKDDVEADPIGATQMLVDAMKEFGVKRFTPMAGEREFGRSFTEKGLYEEVERSVEEYERWAVFFIGIIAFDMPKRDDIAEYRKSKSRAKRAQTKANKAAAAKFRRDLKAEKERQKKRGKKR